MPFNIAEFSATVSRRGLSKNNLFLVTISLPNTLLQLEDNVTTRDLTFLCKNANLPSFDIGTVDIFAQGFGRAEKRPVAFNSGPLATAFMVDSEFGTLKFFHSWVQSIVNYNTMNGYFQEDNLGKTPFEYAYKNDYAATISVIVYSGNSEEDIYIYEFGNAFPINVGAIDMAWENGADIMTLPVAFEYDKFTVSGAKIGQLRPEMSEANGLLTYISAINGYGQAIQQLSRPRGIQDIINRITNVNTIFNRLL